MSVVVTGPCRKCGLIERDWRAFMKPVNRFKDEFRPYLRCTVCRALRVPTEEEKKMIGELPIPDCANQQKLFDREDYKREDRKRYD